MLVGLALGLAPHPAGLSAAAWGYLALFVAAVVALVLEPVPASVAELAGVTVATALGLVETGPEASIRWGLLGFSDPAVWLIFAALVLSTGYEV